MGDTLAKSFSGGAFNKAFPLPKYLRMHTAGIDISDGAVRFVELGQRGNRQFVKSFGSSVLRPGVVSSGFINKPGDLIDVLSKVKNIIGNSFVNVSLPEEKAYIFKIQIPKMDISEIADAVGFRIEENAPIMAKEAIYDFNILDNPAESDHLDVLVSVIPSKVAETYAHVVKAAGFLPISFEIGSQAIGRAVVPQNDQGSYLIVNFGETKTGLAIVSQSTVFFSSTISYGAVSFDEEIIKNYKLSREELENFKAEIMSDGRQNMNVFLQVMETTSLMKDEIKKLMIYWKTHGTKVSGGESIRKIIFCGSNSALPSFDEYFEAMAGVPVEIANPWRNSFSFDEYIPPISRKDSLDYVTAIGLSMIS